MADTTFDLISTQRDEVIGIDYKIKSEKKKDKESRARRKKKARAYLLFFALEIASLKGRRLFSR